MRRNAVEKSEPPRGSLPSARAPSPTCVAPSRCASNASWGKGRSVAIRFDVPQRQLAQGFVVSRTDGRVGTDMLSAFCGRRSSAVRSSASSLS